jgi:hypothetical protein
VNRANTTTAVSSLEPNSSFTGEDVTIGYAVSVTSPGALVSPTTMSGDTVTVADDQGNTICSGTVEAGQCQGRIPAAGARTLTATFAGDRNFNSSSADAAQTVNRASTTTVITSHSPNPSGAGEPVKVDFTVAVVAPGMVVSPTAIGSGLVTVRDDQNNVVCTGTVLAGTCTGPTANAGPRTLAANYAGDTNFEPSVSPTVSQMMAATHKNECKSSGWVSLFRRKATTFINQGDCIRYVNTGK